MRSAAKSVRPGDGDVRQVSDPNPDEPVVGQPAPGRGRHGQLPAKLNIHGGALAIGHPLGASGGRLIGRAAHELARRCSGVAVATACIGVGQALAIVLER